MPPINLRDYAHTAAQRGWGMGWPSCAGAKASGTAVVTAKRSGTRMSWHVRIARLAATLMDETERRGYLLKPGQCGAYNCRPIAGTSTASNHSWGLAGDINWQTNPFTRPRRTDMPAWLPLLWNRYGFAWGGNYGNDGTTGKADCFTGDTLLVTEDGPRPIRDLAGQRTVLLSTIADPREAGNTATEWIKAPVESYGVDRAYEVTLRRRNVTHAVRCTAGHRWPLRCKDKRVRFVTTADLMDALRQGDRVPALQYPTPDAISLDDEAIARGIMWGDGSVYNRHGQRTPQGHVQLCGEKVELADRIAPWTRYWRPSEHGRNAWGLPAEFKQLPDVDSPLPVLAGFFAGWFACDGYVHDTGVVPPSLSTSEPDAVAWLHRVAPALGVTITNVAEQAAGKSGFGSTKPNFQVAFRRLDERLLIRAKHRDRQPERRWFDWAVDSVRDTGQDEEVFCPTVDGRHVVGLATNSVPILSGQSMHLEFMGTPEQADEMTALALRELTGTTTTTTTAEGFLMALTDSEQREILDGIRKLKPGLALPGRSKAWGDTVDDSFGWAINAAAAAADAANGVQAVLDRMAGAAVPGAAQLTDADVQRIAAAVVALTSQRLAS